ncbi:MAG TPA: hypothetical protein VFL95_09465 [Gemmatimonadales bacterium]|nr:hypothetical protein [Gemmatimonadales bacterium]
MTRQLVFAAAGIALLAIAAPAHAQEVSADIHIGTPPARRVVVVERAPAPREHVVVVERFRGHPRGQGYWKKRGYRPVTVYYYEGRFYDRFDARAHPHATKVVIYRQGDRYYREWDKRFDRDDHDNGRHRGHRGRH